MIHIFYHTISRPQLSLAILVMCLYVACQTTENPKEASRMNNASMLEMNDGQTSHISLVDQTSHCNPLVESCEQMNEQMTDQMVDTCDELESSSEITRIEICGDMIDNDCDDQIDEGFTDLGTACVQGLGACQSIGTYQCDPIQNKMQCVTEQIDQAQVELACDELDNDCDGRVDESSEIGNQCVLDQACSLMGELACQNQVLTCMASADTYVEYCNFEDDDCDGQIDEEASCGSLIVNHCALWLGWSRIIEEENETEEWLIDRWGECPGIPLDFSTYEEHNLSTCTSTGGDQMIHRLNLYHTLGGSDTLGIAWSCHPQSIVTEEEAQVIEWAQKFCHIALVVDSIYDEVVDLNPAIDCRWDYNRNHESCAQTIDYPWFSYFEIKRRLDEQNQLGIAFWCDEDPNHVGSVYTARRVMNEATIQLAVHKEDYDFCHRFPSVSPQWDSCVFLPGDADQEIDDDEARSSFTRCITSNIMGTFTTVSPYDTLRGCDQLGIGLLLRSE